MGQSPSRGPGREPRRGAGQSPAKKNLAFFTAEIAILHTGSEYPAKMPYSRIDFASRTSVSVLLTRVSGCSRARAYSSTQQQPQKFVAHAACACNSVATAPQQLGRENGSSMPAEQNSRRSSKPSKPPPHASAKTLCEACRRSVIISILRAAFILSPSASWMPIWWTAPCSSAASQSLRLEEHQASPRKHDSLLDRTTGGESDFDNRRA